MYLSVNSKSEYNYWEGGTGKTMWLNNQPKVAILRTAPDHIGKPPWHLEMSMEQYIEHSSGARTDGNARTAVVRTAELQLTPADVAAIFAALNKAGLISVSVTVKDAHAGP